MIQAKTSHIVHLNRVLDVKFAINNPKGAQISC